MLLFSVVIFFATAYEDSLNKIMLSSFFRLVFTHRFSKSPNRKSNSDLSDALLGFQAFRLGALWFRIRLCSGMNRCGRVMIRYKSYWVGVSRGGMRRRRSRGRVFGSSSSSYSGDRWQCRFLYDTCCKIDFFKILY